MRVRFLCSVVVGLVASSAWAKCEADGLYVFPAPGAVVPTNVKFLVEATGAEVARVGKLVGGEELVLKAGPDDIVTVKVERGWTSTMKRVALKLTPKTELKPNLTYTLMIDRVLPGYKVLNPNAAQSLTWTTGGGADKTPPTFQARPVVAEGLYSKQSEGVAKFLKIRTSLSEEGAAYFVATIKRARGSTVRQTYPVPIMGGEALLGHDPCSGGFTFDDGRAYKISLEVFDSAGNKAVEKLPEIEAQAPLPN